MAVEDKYIRASSSDPEIDEKISIDIKNPDNKIYWYIGFNNSLDETSVNNKSMYVIDREGYILETNIRYLPSSNLIQISPIDGYIQGNYYILCITKDVRSANKKNFEKRVNILFRIKENNVIKYQLLPDNVAVPEPKKKKSKPTKSKVYSFQKGSSEIESDLKPAEMFFNPLLGALGLILTLVSLIIANKPFTLISVIIAALGIVHLIVQFLRPEMKSNIIYNLGVSHFNRGDIKKAEVMFKRAAEINPGNELAEYALNKLSYYE